MANFNKSFNFRGGFQVDESTFLVRGSRVGIGSTIPQASLDVDGTVRAEGLVISSEQSVGIQSANVGFLSVTTLNVGVASIKAGVYTATTPSGIATYYGDGRFLLGLPTSQWLDVDVGLGFTSIYAQGNVGVSTNDPRFNFQVGGAAFANFGPVIPPQNGVGINSNGDIFFTGLCSAYRDGGQLGEFVGVGSRIVQLNGTNITVGAIPPNAYDTLIITEEVRAPRLTGVASTAASILADADISFDRATARELEATQRFLSIDGIVSIGTTAVDPDDGDIQVIKAGDSSIYSISTSASSRIFVGSHLPNLGITSYGGIRYGGGFDGSNELDLDLINYSVGNINLILNALPGDPGSVRFIDGTLDRVLATMDRQGLFSLEGNLAPSEPTFAVNNGLSTFDRVSIADSIGALNAFINNLTISDELVVNGLVNLSNPIFTGIATATIAFVAGNDPELTNSTGIKLKSNAELFANSGSIVFQSAGTPYFSVNQLGLLSVNNILVDQNVTVTNNLTVNNSINSLQYDGPDNLSINATGLSIDNITTNNLTANLDLTASSATITNLTVDNQATFGPTNFINQTNATINNLDVTNSLTGNFTSLPGGITFQGSTNISGDSNVSGIVTAGLSLDTPDINVGFISARSTGDIIGINTSINVVGVSTFNNLDIEESLTLNDLIITTTQFVIGNNDNNLVQTIGFNISTSTNTLQIELSYDPGPTGVGTTTWGTVYIPYLPSTNIIGSLTNAGELIDGTIIPDPSIYDIYNINNESTAGTPPKTWLVNQKAQYTAEFGPTDIRSWINIDNQGGTDPD